MCAVRIYGTLLWKRHQSAMFGAAVIVNNIPNYSRATVLVRRQIVTVRLIFFLTVNDVFSIVHMYRYVQSSFKTRWLVEESLKISWTLNFHG